MRRDAWVGWIAAVAAVSTIAALGASGWVIVRSDDRLKDLIDQNHRSLLVDCAKQADLNHKITRTENVLERNPGSTIFGIPRALVEQGLAEDINTRDLVAGILTNACEKEDA